MCLVCIHYALNKVEGFVSSSTQQVELILSDAPLFIYGKYTDVMYISHMFHLISPHQRRV